MYRKDGISFSTELEEQCKITVAELNDEYEGNLYIFNGKIPYASLLNAFPHEYPTLPPDGFRADVNTRSQHFVLWECQGISGHIYPKYVTQGDIAADSITGIRVLVEGVTSWLMDNIDVSFTETQIAREKILENFNQEIVFNDGSTLTATFTPATYVFSEESENRKTVIEDQVWVEFTFAECGFNHERVIELSSGSAALFSLLLGYQLSIQQIVLLTTDQHVTVPLIFPVGPNTGKKTFKPHECISFANTLFQEKLWGAIFENFFTDNSENFKHRWNRLIPSYSSYVYWDLQIFGCMSIIDNYVQTYAASHTFQLSRSKSRLLKRELKKCLHSCGDDWTEDELRVRDAWEDAINFLERSHLLTFRKRLSFWYDSLPPGLRDILDFTENDFTTLVKIRNNIGHANPHEEEKVDISDAITAGKKAFALVLCAAYIELGIPLKTIAVFLLKRFHPVLSAAKLNTRAIDFVSDRATLIRLTDEDFIRVQGLDSHYPVFEIIDDKNNARFNEEASAGTKEWLLDRSPEKRRSVTEVASTYYPENSTANIEFDGGTYVQTPSMEAPEGIFAAVLVRLDKPAELTEEY